MRARQDPEGSDLGNEGLLRLRSGARKGWVLEMTHRTNSVYVWDVQGSVPTVHVTAQWSNTNVWVLAASMERALELARHDFPEIVFHQCIRRHGYTNQGVIVDFDALGSEALPTPPPLPLRGPQPGRETS